MNCFFTDSGPNRTNTYDSAVMIGLILYIYGSIVYCSFASRKKRRWFAFIIPIPLFIFSLSIYNLTRVVLAAFNRFTFLDDYIKDMIIAAPLHDIGKIHVPDSILDKPGKLTDEEFEAMKSHTTYGYKILKHVEKQSTEIPYIQIAKQMAKSHHEWMNGRGYPEGLSGDLIPLCAKIMAVADVFDALVSKRCYKDPMPLEKAYDIMHKETGDHFDPEVSAAFFAAKDEIEQIMREE